MSDNIHGMGKIIDDETKESTESSVVMVLHSESSEGITKGRRHSKFHSPKCLIDSVP